MPGKRKPYEKDVTAQEMRFCRFYIDKCNYADAYLAAGFNSSRKTAGRNGYRLLHNPRVWEYYQKLLSEIDANELINTKEVILQLSRIAFADIKNYQHWKGKARMAEKTIDGETVTYLDGPEIILNDSDHVDGSVVKKISMSPKDGFQLELEPRLPALQLLAKIKGMLIDKSEAIVKNVNLESLTDEQLERLAQGEAVEKVLLGSGK